MSVLSQKFLNMESIQSLMKDRIAPPVSINSLQSDEMGSERHVLHRHSFQIPAVGKYSSARRKGLAILKSRHFDNVIGAVVFLNALSIGLDGAARVSDWSAPARATLEWLESFFLCAYTCELSLRFFVMHLSCLADNWVKFDCILVTTSVPVSWVLPLISNGRFDVPRAFMVLRLARLLRLARMLRIIAQVRELWILVRSLAGSAGTIVYTVGCLFVVLYMFACIAVELITLSPAARGPDADDSFQDIAELYFPSIGVTMLTLMQFVTLDSISAIYKPLILRDPNPPFLCVYFMLAIVIIGIVILNLITAVVVNSALEQASKDSLAQEMFEEREKKALVKALRKVFTRLDADNSGCVSLAEIELAEEEDKLTLSKASELADFSEVFGTLDADESGSISIDEFCDGLWQISVSRVPLEFKRTEKLIRSQRRDLDDFLLRFTKVQDTLDEILLRLPARGQGPAAGAPAKRDAPSGWDGAPSCIPDAMPAAAPAWLEQLALRVEESVALGIRQELSGLDASARAVAPGLPLEMPAHASDASVCSACRASTAASEALALLVAELSAKLADGHAEGDAATRLLAPGDGGGARGDLQQTSSQYQDPPLKQRL